MLGGARAPAAAAAGSRAGRSRSGRAAHCHPSPGPPPVSALLSRLGQARKAKTKRLLGSVRRGLIYLQLPGTRGSKMVCGGFACSKNCLCALNLLYTVSIPSPCLPAWGLCTCLVPGSLASLPGQRLSYFIPRPLPVFPRLVRPGPRRQPPTATGSRRLSQSLPFPDYGAAVFLARWPGLCHIALPRPLIHRLVFQLFDQTFPLSSRRPF